MKNKTGWIMLHRKILENPISSKPAWAWLWVVLLLLANHDENEDFIWNGELKPLKKGQFITGRKKLSNITGIAETTIEDILRFLERQQNIRQQKTTKYRLITILNWEKYQKSDTKSDNKATTKRQQSDTNNNDNNDNNDNNIREVEIYQTPSQEARKFFNLESDEIFNEFKEKTQISEEILKKEFQKFILYWTERNKSGTKQRWEQQNTFEVRRRLSTWLNNIKNFSNKKETKIL